MWTGVDVPKDTIAQCRDGVAASLRKHLSHYLFELRVQRISSREYAEKCGRFIEEMRAAVPVEYKQVCPETDARPCNVMAAYHSLFGMWQTEVLVCSFGYEKYRDELEDVRDSGHKGFRSWIDKDASEKMGKFVFKPRKCVCWFLVGSFGLSDGSLWVPCGFLWVV